MLIGLSNQLPITESEANFGEFEMDDLFHIEESDLLKKLEQGIKTVEFICYDTIRNSIIFLESKKGCPSPKNKLKGEDASAKFDEYYDAIAEKFKDSLQIYLAAILDNYDNASEIGINLKKVKPMKNREIKFVLVLTADEIIEDWLLGPKQELELRLKKLLKIWRIKVVVLNKPLAIQYGIIRKDN